MTVILSLGSNIDAEANVRAALERLAGLGSLERVSRLFRTPPYGVRGGPPFVNAVAVLRTDHADLKPHLRAIEAALGRVRPAPPNSPRTIDIDVVDPDDAATFDLPYVVVPLADVAPDLRHPRTGATARELSAAVDACAAL